MHTDRINFLDVHFDRLTFQDVKRRLQAATRDTPYAYVVTPNVDHIIRIHKEPALRELYDSADICVCDSRVLRILARLRGIRIPLVAGSDLCGLLFSKVIKRGDRIAIVGAHAADVDQLRLKFPHVEFVHHAPPHGLLKNPDARRWAADFIAASQARFSLVAVGSPQQEMIANAVRGHRNARGTALCIGAGLDFVTGTQKRAPNVIQRLSLEWAHRLATNPRRLWRRYLIDDMAIFPIYLRWRPRSAWPLWLISGAAISALVAAAIYAVGFDAFQRQSSTSSTVQLPPAVAVRAVVDLPAPDLLRPLSPEEAAEQNAERPFVNRPDSPASKFVLRTDMSDRERALTCLTQAVYYEAASEGVDGGRAVAQVVLNRMRHPGYPASVCGVVYQGSDRATGCQFTFTCDGSLLRTPIASLWARSRKIAEAALAGGVFAPVGHATHYHADYVLPYWADSLDKTVQIGRHIFYRLRNTLGDRRSFFQRYAGAEPQLPQPEAPGLIPPAAVTPELANALISDDTHGLAKDVEKVTQPDVELAIDGSRGTLIVDGQLTSKSTRRPKSAAECPAGGDRKQLTPLGANDVRSGSSTSGC
jgi:exopolysaccharide biosynthesis WecB/TagA/CpsF family protein